MSERTELTARQESMPERTHDVPAVTPQVDIFENDEEILVYADMPGVLKDQVSVNIENGRLEISGTRKLEITGATGWEEFGDVEYRRVFSVPQTIDVAKVNAELKEGTLRLHLPKAEAAKPRKIEIRTA